MCPTAPVSNGSSMMGSVVAPSLGTIICFFMWLSPMTAVLEARKVKSLHLSTGPLNPIPFGITVMNCIAWTTYACQRRDYFILCANGTGLALGMFYVLSVLPCMDTGIDTGEDSEDTLSRSAERQLKLVLEVMIVAAIAVWTLVVMSIFIALDPSQPADAKTGQMVVSSLGVMMSTSYYASPLTTMYTVVKSRNSESMYVPMILMNLVNALMWVTYGIAGKPDPMIWGPNLAGALLAVAQMALALWYHPIHPVRRLIMAAEAAGESCKELIGLGTSTKNATGGHGHGHGHGHCHGHGHGAGDLDQDQDLADDLGSGPAGRADQRHSADGLGSAGRRGSGSPGRGTAGSGKSTASAGSGGGGNGLGSGVGVLDVDTEVIIQYSDEEPVIHSPLWGANTSNKSV